MVHIFKEYIKIIIYSFNTLLIVSLALSNEYDGEQHSNSMDSLKAIHIVSHGWHTGIIINKVDLSESLWPINIDFSGSKFLEIGWGDKDFYMNDDPNYLTALKAAIWPTKSVLHVVGFNKPIKTYFISSEIIKIRIDSTHYRKMCDFIKESFMLLRSIFSSNSWIS